jgi:hypothetical protein
MIRTLLAILAPLALLAAGCRKGPDVGQKWPDADRKLVASARASCDIGQAKHVEDSNLTPLNSDWESVFVRPRLQVDLRTRPGLEVSAEFSGIFTDEDREEEWELYGNQVSENELGISGHEFRALVGWGVDVQYFGRVSLLGGLSGRFVELERRLEGGEHRRMDADLYLWELEARLALPLHRDAVRVPVTLEISASYGRVIDPEADIDGAGTIEANHAWLFRTRAGFDVQLTERLSLYIGGFYEDLVIEGGVKDDVYEWADSESTAGGGEVGVRVRF